MTGSAGSLSMGERVGVRDFAHESGIAMQSPSPPALSPGEREPYRLRWDIFSLNSSLTHQRSEGQREDFGVYKPVFARR